MAWEAKLAKLSASNEDADKNTLFACAGEVGLSDVDVTAVTVDLLLRDRTANSLIVKISVQGSELAVLRGMKESSREQAMSDSSLSWSTERRRILPVLRRTRCWSSFLNAVMRVGGWKRRHGAFADCGQTAAPTCGAPKRSPISIVFDATEH